MANSAINISANAQEVVNLRKRIDELKAALSSMRRSTDPAAYDKLNRELQTSSIRYNRLVGDLQRYVSQQQQAERVTRGTASSMSEMQKMLLKIGGTTALMALGKQVIDVRAEMQMLEQSFDVLLGGKDVSNFMSQLKQFAVDSPLSLTGVANAAQTLLGFNVEADKTIPIIKQIGDISMGNEERFKSLTLAFAQMSATGKLMGQDLLQMINAGFNPLQEISSKTGKSIADLKKEMENGSISSQMVADAFASATAQGGRFYGMTEKQAQGVKGLQAQLEGGLQDAFNEIGQSQEGIIAGGYKMSISMVENYDKVGKALIAIVSAYGVYKAALVAAITLERIKTTAAVYDIATKQIQLGLTLKNTVAQLALNKAILANPYALAASLIVGLVIATWSLYDATTTQEKAQKRLNEINEETKKQREELSGQTEQLIGTINTETKSKLDQIIAYKELQGLFPAYLKNLDLATFKAMKLADQQNLLNNAMNENEANNLNNQLKELQSMYDRLNSSNGNGFGGLSEGVKVIDEIREKLKLTYDIDVPAYLKTQIDLLQKQRDEIQKNKQEADIRNKPEAEQIKYINEQLDILNKKKSAIEEIATKAENLPTPFQKMALKARDALSEILGINNEISRLQNWLGAVKGTTGANYQQSYKDAEKNYKDAQKAVASIKKDSKATVDEYNKAIAAEKKAKEDFEKLGGQTKVNNAAESAAKKARKLAQEIADQNEKIKQLEDKQGLERKRQNEDLVNQETQASISAMRSGAEKVKRQKELDNELEIQALERQKEDYIQKIIQNQREIFEAQEELKLKQDNKYVKKAFDPTSVKTDTSLFDSMIGYTRDSQQNKSFDAIDKAWNEYFIKFGNYQQKRAAIVEKYNKEIAEAQTDGDKAVLEKEMNNQLDDLDNSVKNSTTLMGRLFADTSRKSVGEIQKIIDEAELLMQYIESVKDGEGNAMIGGESVSKDDIKGLGISENTINNLQLSTQELEALRNAINKLKGDLGGKSPFKLFETQIKDSYKSIKEGIASGDSKKIGIGISNIGGAIQGITPELKGFGNSMGQIFGEQTGDDINTIVDLLGNTAQIGQGVGKIMAGDVVGGIKDAITGIGNIFAMGSDASKRHKEALKEINQAVKAQEHAYQLALKLKSLEYEKGDTVFGDDPYGKAINAAKEYKDAIEDLKESLKGDGKLKQNGLFDLFNKTPKTSDYAALQNIDIVTGHKKTGLFGWGKGKDTYSGILSVYPELIDGQGKFNAELAKTILSEREMSDENKKTLNQFIENADAIEDAYSVMKDYLTDIFGDLGDSMTDALVNAFQKGEDASKAFYDSASEMIQNLVKDMINSAVIAPVIQKATEDAMKAMEDTSLTNEQRMDKLMSIVDNALDQGLAASDTAKDLYDYANNAWKDKTGKDLYKPKESSQSSSYGTSTSMDQETGGAILGRLTGVHEELIGIAQNVGYIAQWNQPMDEKFNVDVLRVPINSLNESCQRIELMMEENRNIALQTFYVVKDIKVDTSNLSEINDKLGRIESNTKAFKGK